MLAIDRALRANLSIALGGKLDHAFETKLNNELQLDLRTHLSVHVQIASGVRVMDVTRLLLARGAPRATAHSRTRTARDPHTRAP